MCIPSIPYLSKINAAGALDPVFANSGKCRHCAVQPTVKKQGIKKMPRLS